MSGLLRRFSTTARVAGSVTVVLAIGVALLSETAYLSISRYLENDMDRTLEREALTFSHVIRDVKTIDEVGNTARSYLRQRTGPQSPAQPILIVRLETGRVLSNTALRLETARGNRRRLDPDTAGTGLDTIHFEGKQYRTVTVPVQDAERAVVAVFQAALPVSPVRDVTRRLARVLLLAGIAITVAGALLSAALARASLSNLRTAAGTARRVTYSSLTERVDYDGPNDEVGQMVGSLNSMLDRLQAAFDEQRRFIADASHELRTPLAVVRGHLELAERPGISDEERQETFDLINDELERMARLTEDLLTLARLESGRRVPFQPLEIRVLIEEAVARVHPLGRANVRGVCPAPLWVEGDPDQLMQALLNLLRNALAFTPPNGLITVECSAEAGKALLRVADTGPGIREEDLPRLFDRFFRAYGARSSEGGGSGLGLAITRRLVELHGGTISAANRPGGGAVFTITLPVIPAPSDGDGDRTNAPSRPERPLHVE